jgi:hypothetical protein
MVRTYIPVKVGDTVELVYTNDELTKLRPGDRGTVTKVEGKPGDRVIWVMWDTGEKLALLEEIDRFKVVKRTENKTS